ncbi:MAG: ATP-binding protein [Bdellovibrionia bacterium]
MRNLWEQISQYRRRRPTGYQFLIYILLFNSFLTVLTTALQLYIDLKWETSSVEDRITQITTSYHLSLANALWSYDSESIQLQLQGIANLPDIGYLRITTPTGETFKAGAPIHYSRKIFHTFDLWHRTDDTESMRLGTLEITASLQGLYDRLLRRIVVILVTNSAKTFPISIFILFIFQVLVARHLAVIANYTHQLDWERLDVPLILPRRKKGKGVDELDQVVNAINSMRRSLLKRIEERNRSERVLQESEARLRAIIDGTMAVIYVKDTAGRFLVVNNRFEELFHMNREEVQGKTNFDVFPRDIAEKFQINDQRVIQAGKSLDLEEVVPLSDGLHTYISLKFPIFNSEGKVSAVCGISTDVTDRKRVAESRIQLLAKTEEMLQMREDFIAIASHELRTPIASLILHARLFERKLESSSLKETPEFTYLSKGIKIMRDQTERLARLVEAMLETSRRTTLELKYVPFEMSDLVQDVVSRFQEEVSRKKYQVLLELQPKVTGRWDILKIEQVVRNLFTNAIKYGEGKPIRITVSSDGKFAILVVQDWGIGISKEDQLRIFNRFERAVSIREYGGMGLGLYITRKIVEAHGGSIRLESEPGKGSKFTITLPLIPKK